MLRRFFSQPLVQKTILSSLPSLGLFIPASPMSAKMFLRRTLARKEQKTDLAGPGISTYKEVEGQIPDDYIPILNARETQVAIFELKRYIEDGLNNALNLITVQCPLIVEESSGFNDMLDRDGSRTPVSFKAGLGLKKPLNAQVVQAVTKWKRFALKQYECEVGQGINTDMRAIRKDYFLDQDHSCYVDQWDWELRISDDMRTMDYLKKVIIDIYDVIKGAEKMIQEKFPALKESKYPSLPDEITFIHAEDLLKKYPDLSRKERETAILEEHGAVFLYGIGYTLEDGTPHELRAADYDDWISPTEDGGQQYHGLNGDILTYNHVSKRRHELSSMGIRVTKDTLKLQLEATNQTNLLKYPYHSAIMNDEIPLSIGGGIGQSRTISLLLKKAMIGEVQVSAWPDELHKIAKKKGIDLLS